MREHIIINKDRTVSVPTSVTKIGNRFEHNVNKVTFDCPRYADDEQTIDLSSMKIYINYIRSDKKPLSSLAENVTVDEADPTIMHFDFRITRTVTLIDGVLDCLVCIKSTNSEGVEEHHWNSDIFSKLTVGKGMENEETIAEENIDLITQLLVNLDTTNAEVSDVSYRIDSVDRKVGSLETLSTEDKSSIVSAVNEVKEDYDDLKSDIKKDYVTPQMFGGKGDGVTDDTIALQNTFNYAINNKVSVYIPSGTYLFDVLTFPLNQDGMIIKGCGKWKTKLKCISDTSQILFNDFLRYDISEICFEGKTTSTVPFIILNGVSHLSKFHDCIFRTNQGVLVHNSAYLSFYDCSFVVLGTNPCKYLLKINGEHFYARNCYFEGASSDLESYGVILSDCHEIYISNSDICNFFGGTGLQIKPESIGSYNIYVDNTTLVRCKTFIDLDCSYSINNINVNIDILDEAKSTKILTLHRDDGKTGILNGINGYINTRGSFNTNNELIIGDLYFGDNKIYVTNYTDNILKYGIYTPVVPVPVGINFPNRNFVLQGNKNIVRCGLLAVSPFYNHNLPSLKYTVVNGATPQKVEFYNTFGGGFGIQATYPESVTNPYTELIIRFVN